MFARIKAALASRERWAEFLKCLHLFSQEVITRPELVALAADIFVAHTELLDELDRLLASRGYVVFGACLLMHFEQRHGQQRRGRLVLDAAEVNPPSPPLH